MAPEAAPAILLLLLFPLEAPKIPPAIAPIVFPVFFLHLFFEIIGFLPFAFILFKLGAEPGTPFAVTFNHTAGKSAAFICVTIPELKRLKTDNEVRLRFKDSDDFWLRDFLIPLSQKRLKISR